MQRSRFHSLRIHIRASSQVLFDRFDVPVFGSIKQYIQFCTRLAAVFAEEIGGFGPKSSGVANSYQLRIHIRTCGDKQFDNFLKTFSSRSMQRSHSIYISDSHSHRGKISSSTISLRQSSCLVLPPCLRRI